MTLTIAIVKKVHFFSYFVTKRARNVNIYIFLTLILRFIYIYTSAFYTEDAIQVYSCIKFIYITRHIK